MGLYADKVYYTTHDAFVVALDAVSGNKVWETAVADYRTGYYMTMAPLVADGKVMVGASGGERGIRGFVAAFDPETGGEIWRSHTIPGPGEPGNETWPGETWRTGGASIWITGSYDPELNVAYWGTGNPGPWIGDQRPGDNLYTNSVVAFDAATGALRGYHQYHHNGSWDWDEVSAPLLIDVPRDGRMISTLVHPGRNGYLWILERSADAITFVEAQPYVFQNVFTAIDSLTGRPTYDPERTPGTNKPAIFCPSLWGGKDWPPAAYSPQTGYLYIPVNENLCSNMVGTEVEYVPGRGFTGASSTVFVVDGADHIGEIQAWNLATGEQAWTHEFATSQNWGPMLTTAGGLLFTGGTNDRHFRALMPGQERSSGRSGPIPASSACRRPMRSTGSSTSRSSRAGVSTRRACSAPSTRTSPVNCTCRREASSGSSPCADRPCRHGREEGPGVETLFRATGPNGGGWTPASRRSSEKGMSRRRENAVWAGKSNASSS